MKSKGRKAKGVPGEGRGQGGGWGGGSDGGRGLTAGSAEGVTDEKREQALAWSEERSNFNYHQPPHQVCTKVTLFDLNGRATPALFDPLIEHVSQSLRDVTHVEDSGFFITLTPSLLSFIASLKQCARKHSNDPPHLHPPTQTLHTIPLHFVRIACRMRLSGYIVNSINTATWPGTCPGLLSIKT